MNTAGFLIAVFEDLRAGWIEVRLIEDRKQGALIYRNWYRTTADLIADIDRLIALATEKNAGVFFGVLPRSARGSGSAKDTLPSRVIWADVDFKDFEGGEAEARELLERFSVPPNIINRSAHGLHIYWLLTEEQSPEELSATAKAVAEVLHADHCHNRDRLLRLPSTFNRKDPANPILVEIERFESDRRVAIEDLQAACADRAQSEPDAKGAIATSSAQKRVLLSPVQAGVSTRVQQLIANDPKISNLFVGRGKKAVDARGEPQDCSGSGYDQSFLCALVKRGITDPAELSEAVQWRPDGHARSKGAEYIQRSVANALKFMKKVPTEKASVLADFKVDKVRYFDQTPTTYEFTVEGKTFRLSTPELVAPKKFRTRLADLLRRIPTMPEPWVEYINALLEAAERIDMPPEASVDPALAAAIEEAIEGFQIGEDETALKEGKALILSSGPLAGRQAFTAKALLRRLREDFPELTQSKLCVLLRCLGCDADQLPNGNRDRFWAIVSHNAREECS